MPIHIRMNALLASFDAQTQDACAREGLADVALAALPPRAPEPPPTIVTVPQPIIPPKPRPPAPPPVQSPRAATPVRPLPVPSPQADKYETVALGAAHISPPRQPARSRPPLRRNAYDAPHAGRDARTVAKHRKGRELVRAWPCRTPIALDAGCARRRAATQRPRVRLDLEWCYGAETALVGRNLWAVGKDRVAFACAALVVVYDTVRHAQRFFRGHGSRRVTCLAVEGRVACSGDAHQRPEVLVWDVETLQVLHRLGAGFFGHSVLVCCFSPKAKALVCIDASENHNLGYWRLDDLRRLARLKKQKQAHQIEAREAHAHWGGVASRDEASDDLQSKERVPAASRRAEVHEPPAVYDGCWMFDDDDEEEASGAKSAKPTFCTVGPGRHVKFWTAARGDDGRSWRLDAKHGLWKDGTCAMFRCVFVEATQLLLTGGGDGRVYAWRGRACLAVFPVAGGSLPVNPVRLAVAGDKLATADATGRLRCWAAATLGTTGSAAAGWRAGGAVVVDVDARGVDRAPARGAPLRDVCFFGEAMVALTAQGVLVRVDSSGAQQVLASGHFAPQPTTQLRACAVLADGRVVTAGGDRLLCVWDVEEKRLADYTRLPRPARCVDCYNDVMAVGLDNGDVVLLTGTLETLVVIAGASRTKKQGDDAKKHHGLGAAGFMAAQAAGQHREAILAEKVNDDGVDSVRLAADQVAVGCRDGAVRVYTLDGTRVAAFGNCGSRISQIDWDSTSSYIRCATASKELRWFNVTQRVPVGAVHAASLAWPSPTTIFGGHAVAAWTKTRAVASVHAAGGLLAAGSDRGALCLLTCPAVVRGAPSVDALAHASSIVCVRWGGERLFSVGGQDRLLLQWRVVLLGGQKPLAPTQQARASQLWKAARANIALIAKTARTVEALPADDDESTASSTTRTTGSRMALCHLCGAANPVTSRARHVAACEERWLQVHEASLEAPGDDLDDPGALPPDPHAGVDFDGLDHAALDARNVESERVFFAHALVSCEHCGRRFRRDALRKHRVSCTASRPFARPPGMRSSADSSVKVSNWR